MNRSELPTGVYFQGYGVHLTRVSNGMKGHISEAKNYADHY